MSSFLDKDGLAHYHNKVKEEISSAAASGVTSFNNRTGAVTPKSGDYSASMVGAVPNTRTVNGKALSGNITLNANDVNALPITGGTLSGDLRIKNSGNFGTKLNFGDNDYVCISEPIDDCMEIRAKEINFNFYNMGNAKFKINDFGVSLSTRYNNIKICPNIDAVSLSQDSLGANSVIIGPLDQNSFNSIYSVALGMNSSFDTGETENFVNGSVAIGYNSHVTKDSAIAIGASTNTCGSYGVALGYFSKNSGKFGVAIGHAANLSSSEEAVLIGPWGTINNASMAIGIGNGVGIDSANNAIAIGSYAKIQSNLATNSCAIGTYATCNERDTIQLGDARHLSKLSCKVSLSVTSDERDKTDITPIEDGAVEFLNKIQAIRYVFNGRELYIADDENLSDVDKANKSRYGMCSYDKEAHALGTKKGERVRVGVLAQEVQKALEEVYGDKSYANLVDDNFFDLNPSEIPEGVENKLTMTYENFIPFLIKAVQELSLDNKRIHEELKALKEG